MINTDHHVPVFVGRAWLMDAHIHLSDMAYEGQMQFILASMRRMRVRVCCVSTDNTDSVRTLELGNDPLVMPFIGMHPERATGDLGAMLDMISANKDVISGIGEIGLDPTYPDADMARQGQVFEAQLAHAERYNKPVSIHARRSLDQVLQTLTSYSPGGVLLHWFDGGKRHMGRAMDAGHYVSFGPLTVYAADRQEVMATAKPDRILAETDGPVRFSRCFGGLAAQPCHIPSVVFCMAKKLHMSYNDMTALLWDNASRYLGV